MKLLLFMILVPLFVSQFLGSEIQPGTVPTREGSWTMTAKINGKKWQAVQMMPPAAASRIIGYNGEDYISFPFSKSRMQVGAKIKFSDDYAVDLAWSDDTGIYGGRTGEMVITKVNGDWVEASFYFTATSVRTPGKIMVTEGFTRFSMAKF